MRKRIYTILIIIIISGIFSGVYLIKKNFFRNNTPPYIAKVDKNSFYIYQNGKWRKQFIKGVNMGVGKPGAFPGEHAITKDEYLRWFKYIGAMNANTIRVYTIQKPDFYNALYEYNKEANTPIYIMHGVWVNEEDVAKYNDGYNPKINARFKKDIKQTIDVIHGNAVIPKVAGYASGKYTKNVSEYVSAWILGIEWDPNFVLETNKKNSTKNIYKGKYVYTKNASPFEAWLAQIGDYAINYESKNYSMQRPLSFTNWISTDMLKHPNEPLPNEDIATVNTENIKTYKFFKPGMFASYHIYPYYPDFMNYQREYRSYKDKNGKINNYLAYLKDLHKHHTMPILVAEFGIPAARGMAHININTGFNQGNIDEKTQGNMDKSMLNDIYNEGYMGGIVFSWQDEWFKRTWNTMDLDMPDRRPFWSNPQTNEQEFGLLAFDPGKVKSKVYVDGDISEWKNKKPVSYNRAMKIYVDSDEKYLYLMLKLKNYNKNKDEVIVGLDTIKGQGNNKVNNMKLKLNRACDFIIKIHGKDDSRIMVDAYYDSFYNIYSKLNMIPTNIKNQQKNSGIFNNEYLCLNKPLYLPQDKVNVPFSSYETGKLIYGDANPKHNNYNSLADYCIKGNNIEVKIPWQLLNFMDPSTKMVIGDLYKNNGIKPKKTDGIFLEGAIIKDNRIKISSKSGFYNWKVWDMPTYHERLKPSYYILKNAFK